MLAANTCAAEFMKRNKRVGLYRVHEGPTPEKMQSLRDYLRNLGLTLGGGDDPSTTDYARLIKAARERPDFEIIQDRKRRVSVKSVSVRVDLGGCRKIKKKKK